jgi:hypothetical protein
MHVAALRALRFRRRDRRSAGVGGLHAVSAVVVRVQPINLPVLGTPSSEAVRPLIGLVPDSFSERQLRDAAICGFDLTLPARCAPRDLAAHILRRLRPFPEYRCLLLAPNGRRKAA